MGNYKYSIRAAALRFPSCLAKALERRTQSPWPVRLGRQKDRLGSQGAPPCSHLLSTAVTRHCSLQRLCPAPVSKDRIQKAKRAINLHNAKALLSINATKSITVKKIEKLLYAMLNKPQNFGRLLAY